MPKALNGEITMQNDRPKLCLNEKDKKFLGVCAGIADFVGVETWMIRLGFIISVIFGGWFMVPAYFIAWFFMDKGQSKNLGENIKKFKSNTAINHFRNVDYKKKLYKNSKEKKIFGVCAGVADYLEVDVTVVRIITVLAMLIPGSVVVLAYFIAFFILDDKPLTSYTPKNTEYSKVAETLEETNKSSRTTFKNCSRKFSAIHERLTRMGAYVTSSKFKLNREFKNID
jgi:phage shock protein C